MQNELPVPLRITLTGFGDVGQAYAAALQQQGLVPRIHHPRPREAALTAAARLGLAIETDPAAAYRDCELVLNVASGAHALSIARAARPVLAPDAVFADLSSAAPAALRKAATYFEAGCYVDVAIMGAVSIHGHATPLLASGSGASRVRDLLAPFGFPIETMPGSAPGDATALKLVRSILTKGMDAVIVECMLVAEALGLRDALLGQIDDLDRSSLSELMAMFVRTHVPHAQRRLHEVEAIRDTLRDLDVPLIVTPAVQQRYARTVETMGAAADLPSAAPGESVYARVLPRMLEAERRHRAQEDPTTGPSQVSIS